MLEYLAIDPKWIEAYRSDSLTHIFKLSPFFASDIFYIMIVAVGYWLKPKKLLFVSLGFLVPFSTLMNCLLKNTFRIPRPAQHLHLVQIDNPFGFPSGDVQVATVVWLVIFLSMNKSIWRYLCLLPIIGIMFARVYLGVHSIYDVLGGLFFGGLIVYLWGKYIQKYTTTENNNIILQDKNIRTKFWCLLIVAVGLYTGVSQSVQGAPVVPMVIGALIGFGLSLPWVKNNLEISLRGSKNSINNRFKRFLNLLLCMIMLVIIYKIIPVMKTNEMIFYASAIVKYAIIVFSILVLIPKFMGKIISLK